MFERIKKWLNEVLPPLPKDRYQFVVELNDGQSITLTRDFRFDDGGEWGYPYSTKEQAKDYASDIGRSGVWQSDVLYPASSIKSVRYAFEGEVASK